MKTHVLAMGLILACSAGLLTACSGQKIPPVQESSQTEPTTAIVQTSPDRVRITDSDGQPVTSIVTAIPTQIVTVTDNGGKVITDTHGIPMTTILIPPTLPPEPPTTTTKTLYTTATGGATATAMVSTTTTASRASATTTTSGAPTTGTTTATTKAPANPWTAPYDLPKILADSRAYAESIGWTWDISLNKDNSSWTGTDRTYAYTYYGLDLQKRVYETMMCYKHEPGNDYNSRINLYFEPDPSSPGDYLIYYLQQ